MTFTKERLPEPGCNRTALPIGVRHSELEVASDNSTFRRLCVVCLEGVLPTQRNDNFKLLAKDHCLLCGQQYRYLDINEMIARET